MKRNIKQYIEVTGWLHILGSDNCRFSRVWTNTVEKSKVFFFFFFNLNASGLTTAFQISDNEEAATVSVGSLVLTTKSGS